MERHKVGLALATPQLMIVQIGNRGSGHEPKLDTVGKSAKYRIRQDTSEGWQESTLLSDIHPINPTWLVKHDKVDWIRVVPVTNVPGKAPKFPPS